MQMARTRLSPMCWATSAMISILSPSSSTVIDRAPLISGSAPGGNSTSTTGPAMPMMRPSLTAEAAPPPWDEEAPLPWDGAPPSWDWPPWDWPP